VTIDVHRSLDRVKDASALGARDVSFLRRVHGLLIAHADGVPLLGAQGTPAVAGGFPVEEETPTRSSTDLGFHSGGDPRRTPSS